jgi:hypothetical protein
MSVKLKVQLKYISFGVKELQKNWKFPQISHQGEAMKEIHNQAMEVWFCLQKMIFICR